MKQIHHIVEKHRKKRRFYKKFLTSLNNYKDFFNSDRGQEIFSKSEFFDGTLKYVCFYDSFDNNEIKTLVKNIQSLDKEKFKYENQYIYMKNGQYLKYQDTSYGVGTFAEIKPTDNEYIESIKLTWCQRSNYTAFMEFQIVFNNAFTDFKSEYNFIINTLDRLNKESINYYQPFDFESIINKEYENRYIIYHHKLLKYSFQKYIENLIYNNLKKTNKLMSLYNYRVKELDLKEVKPSYMGLVGKHKEHNTAFFVDHLPSTFEPTVEVEIVADNFSFDHRSILPYFSQYRNLLYYNVNFDQELETLNKRISKYNLKVNTKYDYENLLWMYEKIIELESNSGLDKFISVEDLNKELRENWEIFYGTFEDGDDEMILSPFELEFSKEKVDFILERYRENYRLYNVALESQNSKNNNQIAVWSLFIASLSFLTAIILGLAIR